MAVITNEEGIYNTEINYYIRDSRDDNRGNAPIALVYDMDGYVIADTAAFTSMDINSDETDEYVLLDQSIDQRTTNTIVTLELKQVDFTTTLSGIIWDNSDNGGAGDGKSTRTVNISYTAANGNKNYSTVSETISTTNNDEKGHYSFDNIEWSDSTYLGDQSSLDVTFTVDNETMATVPTTTTIYSGKDNTFQVEIN